MTKSSKHFEQFMAEVQASPDYARMQRNHRRIERLCGWMRRVPYVGRLMWVFWGGVLHPDEGIVGTCKPRWGTLTFCFLNDGFKPTLWHTWYSVTHDNTAPLSGIYTKGAPRSRKEAENYDR